MLKRKKHFFADTLTYQNRLVLLSFLMGFGAVLTELILAQWGKYYSTCWGVILTFLGLSLLFVWIVKIIELTKKQLAWMATILSIMGLWFLTFRIADTQFNPLVITQFTGVAMLSFFIFERLQFLIFFASAFFLGLIPLISTLNLNLQNHILFIGLVGIITAVYAVGFMVNIKRIKLLMFSEGVLSTYDRYIIVFDEFAEAIYVSPYIAKELGLDLHEIQKKSWWKIRGIPDEEANELKQIIINRIRENKPVPLYKQTIVKPNGERRIIEWNAQIVGGKYHVGHGTDVTDDLNAKKEAEKLSTVTKALGAGIIIANSKGEIVWCNTAFASIFGYTVAELMGKRPSAVFAVPDFFQDEYKKLLNAGIENGQQFEIPHYRKDGRLIWVLIQSSNLSAESGSERETIEVVTDITKQKNSELESKQISLIAERTQTPVLICDQFFTINWINSAMLAEFKCQFEDVLGFNFLSFYYKDSEQDDRIETLINSVKLGESCQIDIQLKKEEEPQWYKLSMDPIENDFGKIAQFMLVIQNIQAAKDAQQIIETKNRDMIASISYAKRIQSALLPDKQLLTENLPEHFFFYKPKDIVSGDFYYVKYLNGRLFIAVADCTGHGVPGAMISSIGAAALDNAILDRQITDPGKILDHTDKYLKNALSASEEGFTDGMDIGIIVLDFNEELLHYAGARRPLIISNKNNRLISVLQGDKRSIGEFVEDDFISPFQTQSMSIDADYLVYLFTDGITDQFGGHDFKKLRFNRLLEIISVITHLEVADQYTYFEDFFVSWTNNNRIEQTDDILLFVTHIHQAYMVKMKEKSEKTFKYDN